MTACVEKGQDRLKKTS